MALITEDQVELQSIDWFQDLVMNTKMDMTLHMMVKVLKEKIINL